MPEQSETSAGQRVSTFARRVVNRAKKSHPGDPWAQLRTRPTTELDHVGLDQWSHDPVAPDDPPSLRRTAGELPDVLPFSKWDSYFDVYDEAIGQQAAASRAAQEGQPPLRLLEIGVFKGGSLQLWREYLGPTAIIYGVDIDPSCAELDVPAQVRIGSQADAGFMASVVDEMGGVDIVIDDGSHVCSHVIGTLTGLYPRLSWGGTYIIEDLSTSYRPVYGGGLRRRTSSIEQLKDLVDEMNSPFFRATPSRLHEVINHDNLASISFSTNMAVLRKRRMPPPRRVGYGPRPE